MSDVLSFAEIAGQYAELLPARTVLSAGPGSGFDYTSDDVAGDALAANSVHHNIVFGDENTTADSAATADDIGDVTPA